MYFLVSRTCAVTMYVELSNKRHLVMFPVTSCWRCVRWCQKWDLNPLLTPAQQDALSKIKETLTSETVLRYYDVGKPITLTVDASMKGLGAAFIQSNGVVAYASRALTLTEQKYAQIEKEALAVVFGCTKFHKMLYGKSDVTVETDH